LIKSKSVEVYLPSVKRKSKLVHLLAMSIFLISVVPTFYQRGRMAYVSKRIPIEDIMLIPNELTDGLSVFSPLESWTLDTVYNDSNMLTHEFVENRSTKYYVASINERFRSRIHFAALQSQNQSIPDTVMIGKVLKKDAKDYTAIKNSALSARKMKNTKLEAKYLQMLVKYGPENDIPAAKARLEAIGK
jgi:hypothetical protein